MLKCYIEVAHLFPYSINALYPLFHFYYGKYYIVHTGIRNMLISPLERIKYHFSKILLSLDETPMNVNFKGIRHLN